LIKGDIYIYMAEDPEVGDESGGGGKRMIITYQCFAEG
jgi:hypothetical protein